MYKYILSLLAMAVENMDPFLHDFIKCLLVFY